MVKNETLRERFAKLEDWFRDEFKEIESLLDDCGTKCNSEYYEPPELGLPLIKKTFELLFKNKFVRQRTMFILGSKTYVLSPTGILYYDKRIEDYRAFILKASLRKMKAILSKDNYELWKRLHDFLKKNRVDDDLFDYDRCITVKEKIKPIERYVDLETKFTFDKILIEIERGEISLAILNEKRDRCDLEFNGLDIDDVEDYLRLAVFSELKPKIKKLCEKIIKHSKVNPIKKPKFGNKLKKEFSEYWALEDLAND